MDSARQKTLLECYRGGLLQDTVPFWLPRSIDDEHGGFITSLDQDGSIVDTDKSTWTQARFTWLLGELYNNVEPQTEWLDAALHGATFLTDRCFDETDGRMWFELTRDGRPLRKRRYSFSESFAAIAYGELAKATGDSVYADRATACFQQFLDHHLKIEPKFTDVRPTRSIGYPMIAIATAQELRSSIDLAGATEEIDRHISQIRDYHVKHDIQCVMETVGVEGEIIDHFTGRTLNPGHAIEAAWFIMLEGKQRSDSELIQLGASMLDYMWNRGWDEQYGGILYFVDLRDLPVQEYWHDMKFWWPQNEAIIATLMAYQLTGDTKYADWHQQCHDWAHQHFADKENGEWFGYLHRDGRLSSTLKGGLWKSPFHLPRMQLMCWKMLEEMQLD